MLSRIAIGIITRIRAHGAAEAAARAKEATEALKEAREEQKTLQTSISNWLPGFKGEVESVKREAGDVLALYTSVGLRALTTLQMTRYAAKDVLSLMEEFDLGTFISLAMTSILLMNQLKNLLVTNIVLQKALMAAGLGAGAAAPVGAALAGVMVLVGALAAYQDYMKKRLQEEERRREEEERLRRETEWKIMTQREKLRWRGL